MEYEGQISRPPIEKSSFMLPVAVGCSYNRCTFCTLFKHLSYRQLPLEQVEAEIKRVHQAGGNPKQIFLGDGNAFGLETSIFRAERWSTWMPLSPTSTTSRTKN